MELWMVSSELGLEPVDVYRAPVSWAAQIGEQIGSVSSGVVLTRRSSASSKQAESIETPTTVGLDVGDSCSCGHVAWVAASFFARRGPSLVLMPSSTWWDDIACRVGVLLDANVSVACSGWSIGLSGLPVFSRPAYDRRVLAIEPVQEGYHIVSVRAEGDGDSRDIAAPSVSVGAVSSPDRPEVAPITVVDRYRIDSLLVDVEESDVVVAGGRGVGGSEGFKLLERLAALLGGTTAGSRIAVDNGWISRDRQVGQTGKTVKPKLYVACGISGSSHHLLGMKDSESIVAINTDSDAPVLRVADVAVIGDCHECVSAIADELEHRQQGVDA